MDALTINKLFREYGRTLGSVESVTGGLFASTITSTSGASHFYKGGFVTYATEEKNRVLGIPYNELDEHGVCSQETAASMSGHAKSLLNVDYCVAFTGNAGPDVMEDRPVGEIFISVSAYTETRVYKYNFEGTRKEIQEKAVETSFEILAELIKEKK